MPAQTYDALSKDELIKLLLERDRDIEAIPHRKKYGLIWENKPEQFEADSVGRIPVLKKDPARSISANPDRPTHVLIQGDNYHALKVLAYTHERSVDVIYIDPPYNTGNRDFKYNDKFVDKEDGYRHSKWLSFMAKRLRLAKTLLKDTGAVFLSIDENEFAQLKLLCDEIFGEPCFVEALVWSKKSGPSGVPPKSMVVNIHEYILCYSKVPNGFKFVGVPRSDETFGNPDNDPRGPWRSANLRSSISTKVFAITNPDTGDVFSDTWAHSPESLAQLAASGSILWPQRKGGQVRVKEYFRGFKNANTPMVSQLGTFTGQGSIELLRDVLGRDIKAMYPKPLELLMRLLAAAAPADSLVLDFFAGSGTTAHAVMQLNAEDGGTRQCILVTNDEGEFKDEQGNLLDGGICTNVTHPRLKKVIEGYTTPKGKEVAGLPENLVFFDTEFVEDRALERCRRELTARSAEMLCLRESTFIEEKSKDKRWRSFTDGHGKRLVVVTDEFAANDLRPLLKADKRETLLYVFRFGDSDNPAREYGGEGLEHVTAKPVPDSLLALHRRIQRQEAA